MAYQITYSNILSFIILYNFYVKTCFDQIYLITLRLSQQMFKFQVYDELKYKLCLEFPSSYPYSAPTVKFVTPCYHPNVDLSGNICLDILKDKWSASYDVRTILLSIQSLLGGKSIVILYNG